MNGVSEFVNSLGLCPLISPLWQFLISSNPALCCYRCWKRKHKRGRSCPRNKEAVDKKPQAFSLRLLFLHLHWASLSASKDDGKKRWGMFGLIITKPTNRTKKDQRNLSQVPQLGAHVFEFLDASPSHYWLALLCSCGMVGRIQIMMSDKCGFKCRLLPFSITFYISISSF